jgi:glucose uptake protein GlcU
MVSLLDGCAEGCGWTAAIIAVVSWGTFGVPLKVNTNVEVNFFVMQSYKTMVCFVTSWLVILLGEEVRFTPWGIVSGLFWVPGAACGIYGIRNAGVAVAVGTWSAIQVSTSFVFGILIFQEHVKSMQQTMLAFCILMVGLVGMSMYSEAPKLSRASKAGGGDYEPVALSDGAGGVGVDVPSELTPTPVSSPLPKRNKLLRKNSKGESLVDSPKKTLDSSGGAAAAAADNSISGTTPSSMIPLELEDGKATLDLPLMDEDDDKRLQKDRVVLFGGRIALPRRQMGMLGAVVNGVWGGLNLIPLHYAQRDQGMSGAGYLISYASGSMLVCVLIWAGLFGYHFVHRDYQWREALDQLPAWHVQELGLPGALAGIFYSIGNFCSILAVTYLGQGVGFSFCQGQLLISGLWGVFYFGEIKGQETITKWFASASITIVGIIWLSFQHEGTPLHRVLFSALGISSPDEADDEEEMLFKSFLSL